MTEFRVLGPLEVVSDDGKTVDLGGRKPRTVLARLLASPGEICSVDQLVEAAWGDKLPANPKSTLQVAVSRLRKVLGGDVLIGREPGYVVRIGADDIDASVFERLVTEARRSAATEAHAAAVERCDEAADLWRGRPFADFEYDDFARPEVTRLEELHHSLSELRFDSLLHLGRHREALPEIEAAVESAPLRERLWELLMLALYRAGRQAEALRTYGRAAAALGDELGIEPGPDLRRLEEMILLQDSALELGPVATVAVPTAAGRPVEASASDARTNIPALVTNFVGRQEDISDLSSMIRSDRLVTLTGPGGVGKTTLAIRVAESALSSFTGGVWLVELAPITDASLVLQEIANAIGVPSIVNGSLEDAIVEALVADETLVVLDNCEHVIDEVADLADFLLRATSGLHIVATSREALAIRGERRYPVPALTLPSIAESDDLVSLASSEAVQLLLDRVVEVRPDFVLSAQNAGAVATICRRLDGIPLGLELAASRFAVLSAQEIAARLDERFELLVSQQRRLPARQRTLENAIEGSVELLSSSQAELFSAAAVFVGGFDLAAADAVCGDGSTVLDDLQGLVAKSLVVVSADGGDSRYSMLESIRAFALRLLEADPERADQTKNRHAAYFKDLVVELGEKVRGSEGVEAVARLVLAEDNVRAALDWLADRDQAAMLEAIAALAPYWQAHGVTAEVVRRTEDAISAWEGEPTSSLARASNVAGVLRFMRGDHPEARAWHEQAISIAKSVGDDFVAGLAGHNLGNFSLVAGDLDEAARAYEGALAAFEQAGYEQGVISAIGNLGVVESGRDNLEKALDLHRMGLELARRAESPFWASFALNNVSYDLVHLGKLDEAEPVIEEAIALAREAGLDAQLPTALANLAVLHLERGEVEEAERSQLEAFELALAGNSRMAGTHLDGFARLATAQGRLERAAMFMGAADRMWQGQSRTAGLAPSDIDARAARVQSVRASLGDAFEALWDRGSAMDVEAILELARDE